MDCAILVSFLSRYRVRHRDADVPPRDRYYSDISPDKGRLSVPHVNIDRKGSKPSLRGTDAETVAAATRSAGFRLRWPTAHVNLREVRADWRGRRPPPYWEGEPRSRHGYIVRASNPLS